METRKAIFFVAVFAFIATESFATKFTVAPAGGTFTSVQAGVNAAFAGDTVIVNAGTYNEAVTFPRSGSAASGYITLLGQPGAILDGTGRGQTGIYINNRNYIRVQGLMVQYFRGTGTPIGISIEGSSSNLEILNNIVHHIENATGNAHGIAFYGTSATPMSNILVDGNEVRNCLLGQSESLVLNGNVTNFIVSNNTVHDNDNIGIDFIGFEGVGPTGSDQARNGICVDNTVYNISTLTNPTYGGDQNADGIYVDGGMNITIERNLVYNCDIGIELASEHAGKNTQDIRVRNNFVSGSFQANIMAGGYAANRGNSVNISIVNNTTYQGSQGEIALQFNCNNITIKNNICYAKASQDYLQEWGSNNTNITVNNNLYFGQSTTSPGAWTDANAKYVNPRLTSAPSNLHLLSTSPAIDAGINLGNDGSGNPVSGLLDKDSQARIINGTIDIGADEFFTSLPINLLTFTVVQIQNKFVSIQWQTSSEVNNNYFEIQRCDDLESLNWQTIYIVKGNHNSTVLQNYECKDSPSSGIFYYRLKQVDLNEQYSYSKVVTVTISQAFKIQNFYPNPASSELQLTLETVSEGLLSFKVYDLYGREIIHGEQRLQVGNNRISMDVSSLLQGYYIIQLTDGKEIIAAKFIKE
jgi:parallel beta-helix repeat protein